MRNRLLETKFFLPTWRNGSVLRQRLVSRLQSGAREQRKLSLISAPAGYGKTTLAAEWLRELPAGARVAWLALDEADNDPVRFLIYWVSALQRLDESLGQTAQGLLGTPQVTPTAVLDELLNELAQLEYQMVLVLDDYHVIHNPTLHEAVEYFIDHQPRQFHLALISREDPPMPLARLRVRGQMTEIRAHDLRFTVDEARMFFNQSMNLDLKPEDIRTLEARTEGWAAGLQLAALALQNQADQQDFLNDFSGSHRYIIDYLLDEVLKNQPPAIRDFLSQTSPLQRFNASLCQAVTDNPEAGSLLLNLEQANLFLIPLDSQRGWYRYHHLFADVLRATLDPQTEQQVHRSAAQWYEENNLLADALPHWLAAPDNRRAAALVNRMAADLFRYGELLTLLGWINALPEGLVNQNPDLITHKVFCLLMTGQSAQASETATRAWQSMGAETTPASQGRLLALQAWFTSMSADPRCGEVARSALALLDEGDFFQRSLTLIALGNHLAWNDDLQASNQVFSDTWKLGEQHDHPLVTLSAQANVAFNLLELGQLREAEALCRASLAQYVDARGRMLPISAIISIPLASICYEKGDVVEAEAHAKRGIELCDRLFSSEIMGGDGEIILARIAFDQGNLQQAFDLLQQTAQSARGMTLVIFKMLYVQAELHLTLGNLHEAEALIQEIDQMLMHSDSAKSKKVAGRLRARYLAASGAYDQALCILDELDESDRRNGYLRRVMGFELLRALIAHQRGNRSQAQSHFNAALRLAAPEGYRSLFFPTPGKPTRPYLEAARAAFPAFVETILAGCTPAVEETPQSTPNERLPEPLSEQELRVLRLLVAGQSNQEIAGELVIGVGTAKWHVHNILQKLGVANRPQAIARARELGLD
ncbi:MAG: hypothetical protein HY835_10855 [Anaerolineae bacterium]|nr:hypothetical protein [Anaerolineae bacterium]